MGSTASSRKKTGNTAASRKKKTDNAAPAKITGRTETGLFTPASREEKMDTAAKITAGRTETGLHTMPARYLTEDIYEEILLRLLAESVLRCRAVCKAWRRIATDPRFLAARPRPSCTLTYLRRPAAAATTWRWT
ncbi:hypothetical protein PR202_ga28887 [Eleusine coracana subsp. coracana]|uniref:F-box domain-containing protein n=1 Tax=Eleusine coracana subsp. coracana TaxID=191504 RepID=A0AAV5DLI6_ELECO|nr:hypothetical protein PR202_ga28887 [Eleusine coracana subsp. coracana]